MHFHINFACIFKHAGLLSVCMQGLEKGSQGDTIYEVVSLQRESERAGGSRGRLQSPTEEEEPEEGMANITDGKKYH